MHKGIKLLQLAQNYHGLIISPMMKNFTESEHATDAFNPHRHDSYLLFMLDAGEINLRIDSEVIHMHRKSILLICPGQVHQVFNTNEISGWVIAFDAKMIDKHAKTVMQNFASTKLAFNLAPGELDSFNSLFQVIYHETKQRPGGTFQLQLLHSLINVCIYKIINLHEAVKHIQDGNNLSRSAEITHKFRSLLAEQFANKLKPADYASILNISISHLNDVVKSTTGFSASHFIREASIAEAQRQLLYRTGTIEEIAGLLGYEDSKYFSRIFTKSVGSSPMHFRKTSGNADLKILKNEVLVFKTDISSTKETKAVINTLQEHLPNHIINVDLQDTDKILRVEGPVLPTGRIVQLVSSMNHQCTEL